MNSKKDIIDALSPFVLQQRLDRLDQVLDARTNSLTLVLDGLRNPHNISAILRSADAFAVSEIHIIGDEFEFSSRISRGSEQWVRMHIHRSVDEALAHLLANGFSLVVLQPELDQRFAGSDIIPITALPFEEKIALVFGNEHKGVSAQLVDAARFRAFIPMYGFVESFNVSVACALTLFCSTLAPTRPQRRSPGLSPDARESLRADWLQQSVKGSELILRDIDARRGNEGLSEE